MLTEFVQDATFISMIFREGVYDVYGESTDIRQVGRQGHEGIGFVCRNGYFSGAMVNLLCIQP